MTEAEWLACTDCRNVMRTPSCSYAYPAVL